MRIALLLFDEVDLLDFGGPYEVFLTADRLLRRAGDDRTFQVISLTLDGEPVTAYGGVGLVPDGTLDSVSDLDVLIVPGAIAISEVAADPSLIESIRSVQVTIVARTSKADKDFTNTMAYENQQGDEILPSQKRNDPKTSTRPRS